MFRLTTPHYPRWILCAVTFWALASCGNDPRPDARPPASTAQAPAFNTQDSVRPDSTGTSRGGGTADESDDARSAAEVIQRYYAAVNAQDFREAYLLWSDSGRASGQTFDDFAEGYAGTDSVVATVGPSGRVEGAAGSRYVEIPVELRAYHRGGDRQDFAGAYTLRRAVVDGATEIQRTWHIYQGDLRQVSH